MQIYLYGIDFDSAPINIREKFHFTDSKIIEFSNILIDLGFEEVVILNTCNRSEIYYISDNPSNKEIIENALKDYLELSDFSDYAIYNRGNEAIEHILKVTCGMKSLVIGEDQILGQVKDAWETAMDIGTSKKLLNKVFREAVALAKSIKTRSDVSDIPTSIAYISIKEISESIELENLPTLVIGMGKMGKLSLKYLNEKNADITISNRTYSNSLKLKEEYPNVKILDYNELKKNLDSFTLIVSATSSPHRTLYFEDFKDRNDDLYLLDLSFPRDIDPEIANIKNVKMRDIDKLKDFSDENSKLKASKLMTYENEIYKLRDDLKDWFENLEFESLMQKVNERCELVSEETLDYIFRKADLNHSQKKKISKIVDSAIKKVSRKPIMYIKNNIEDPNLKHEILKQIEKSYEY